MVTNEELIKKLDQIQEQTTLTRIDVAKIEEHLKTLNGRVLKNETKLEKLKDFDAKLGAKVAGLAGTLALIVSLVIGFILK